MRSALHLFIGLIVSLGIWNTGYSMRAGVVPPSLNKIQRIFVVVFENTNAQDSLSQPFMKDLVTKGAYLSNFHAETHPSQPNYIAMVAGGTFGVRDNSNHMLNVRHLGDLIEAKGKTWKSYAENYPGGCFTGAVSADRMYWRKHEPFISFANVQSKPDRCASHIVNANTLNADIGNGTLPDYALYVPGIRNDGHDTGVAFADQWLANTFGPKLQDPKFMNGTLFVITFDENDSQNDHDGNLIYTVLYGDSVIAGSRSSESYNHYSLIKLVETALGLGNLGAGDVTAPAITGVWK